MASDPGISGSFAFMWATDRYLLLVSVSPQVKAFYWAHSWMGFKTDSLIKNFLSCSFTRAVLLKCQTTCGLLEDFTRSAD